MKTFKTGKKILSVFLAMLIIMTSVVAVPSFAADDNLFIQGEHIFEYSVTIEPTCSTDGYEIWSCRTCSSTIQRNPVAKYGHLWEAYTQEPTCTERGIEEGLICTRKGCNEIAAIKYIEPLGHVFSDWYKEPQANGIYYYNKHNCTRNNNCDAFEYETEAGAFVKYYKVDFVNEWNAKKYYTTQDGTDLAYSNWSEEYYNVNTVTYFVKNGDLAKYEGEPTRYKTKEYGRYIFDGWEKKIGLTTYEDFEITRTPVTTNLTLRAKFKGDPTVTYSIVFGGYEATTPREGESILHTYQHIPHGQKIQFNPARYCEPQHADKKSPHYYYTFNGWDLIDVDESTLVDPPVYVYGDDVTTVEIYRNHSINPTYESTPKKYKVIYHDNNGNIIYNKETGENGCVFEYGTLPSFVPTDEDGYNILPEEDHKYYYAYGEQNFRVYKWKFANGSLVDINQLMVPSGTAEYDEVAENNPYLHDEDKGIIHLYPNIAHFAKNYKLHLYVMDIDGETPAEGASIQITDIVADGQAAHLIGAYVVDEHGYAELSLNYAEPVEGTKVYKITATLDGRKAEGYITEGHFLGDLDRVELKLVEPEGKEDNLGCTCVCHSFFGKIYITFLNLVYKITGKKIVCCYDMYIRHGDKLVYS